MERVKQRNLVLPLKAEFFHAIREGRKPLEYRLRNPYWTRRIAGREFDQIILTLGYLCAMNGFWLDLLFMVFGLSLSQ